MMKNKKLKLNPVWSKIVITLLLVALLMSPGQSLQAVQINYALGFDGVDDYADLGRLTSIYGSQSWRDTKSIVIYIKPATSGTPCPYNDPALCILIAGTKDTRWWGITQGVIDGLDRIWVWNAGITGPDQFTINKIGVPYTPGEWVQIAFVHSDGVLRAYRNGDLVGSIPSGRTQIGENQNPRIILGSFVQNADPLPVVSLAFQGQLDEVRIYDTALTREAILPHIHTEIPDPQNEAGLLAYYQMTYDPTVPDQEKCPQMEYLRDDTGRGHDGNLCNGVEWIGSPIFDDEPVPVTHYIYLPVTVK